MNTFPWRKFSSKELLEDFKKLSDNIEENKIYKNEIKKRLCGYNASNFFFQKERLKTKSQNKESSVEYWVKNKNYVKRFQKKYNQDLFCAIVFLSFAPSQFSPYAAGLIYKYFNATKVFDPYAGWGDRCLAAMSMNIDYIGCDSNTNLQPCYERMFKEYSKYTNSNIDMFFGYSEEVFKKIPLNVDLLFTSPPFFSDKNKLVEEYYHTETDYDKFMKTSLIPIITKCLQKNIIVCVYIPENMYKYLKEYIGRSKKIIRLSTRNDTHNNKKSKSNNIYCWYS